MVLVTGATGHIGNNLVRSLVEKGETVRVLIHRQSDNDPLAGLNVERAIGDVTNKESLLKACEGVEKVFHLAAVISILPKLDKNLAEVNIQGTKNIAEVCIEKNIKMIYTSSVHALPDLPHGQPITEEAPIDPEKALGKYGQTKAMATLALLDLIKNKGLQCVIVHPAGVVGRHDYHPSQMGWLIGAMMSWMFVGMSGVYNFVDVRDIVNGILLADSKGRIGERYILSGHIVSIGQIKSYVDKAMNRSNWYVPMPKFLVRLSACMAEPLYGPLKIKPILTHESLDILYSNADLRNDKAIKELGWSVVPFEDTVADTVQWIKEQK
ncbi:MAG: NAD-dependent epimerase/dehydratase family protein [Brevinema sp.]